MEGRCEHAFWGETYRLNIDEPVAAVSGLVMSFIALSDAGIKYDDPLSVLQFFIARASLVICGFGTFVYHALGEEQTDAFHLNGYIFDGVSMALVTINVFLLFLNDFMKQYPMSVSLAVLFYLYFWIVTNDLVTCKYLSSIMKVNGVSLFSMAVQYSSFVAVYIYILLVVYDKPNSLALHWPMWASLSISLIAWCLYQFACDHYHPLFIAHTIWHIGIGYVAHYLMVVGAASTYGYDLSRDGTALTMIRKTEVPSHTKTELEVERVFLVMLKMIRKTKVPLYAKTELKVENIFRSMNEV